MADLKKQIFIDTIEALFTKNSSDVFIPQEAIDFFEDYKKCASSNKKAITEKGINILKEMRELDEDAWISATALGQRMDISGKSVSGTMRKLVTDGYVEKRIGNPASYRLTEKGRTCTFDIEEN